METAANTSTSEPLAVTQTWVGADGNTYTEPLKGRVAELVEAVGERSAFELIFHLGGSPIYISRRGHKTNLAKQTVGPEAYARLVSISDVRAPVYRVPLGLEFCCRYLSKCGYSTLDIARMMKCKDDGVRWNLKPRDSRRGAKASSEDAADPMHEGHEPEGFGNYDE